MDILSLCRELPRGDKAPPEWLLLAPKGAFVGRDGREYLNQAPQIIVDAFDAPIPFDWEHATHLKAPKGDPAPAAAWIVELQAREDGLWGRVEWTDAGAEAVSSRSYRYYSPAYLLDGRSITRLASAGLTNQPNLDLPALNARFHSQEPAMDKVVLDALGLSEGATSEQAVAKITDLKTSLNQAQQQANLPDLARFAPREDLQQALNRADTAERALAEQQQAALNQQVEALLQEGLNSARISPATVEYHRAVAQADGGLEKLKDYLAKAPALAMNQPAAPQGTPPEGDLALNAQQSAIAAAFGNSPEDLAKYGDRSWQR